MSKLCSPPYAGFFLENIVYHRSGLIRPGPLFLPLPSDQREVVREGGTCRYRPRTRHLLTDNSGLLTEESHDGRVARVGLVQERADRGGGCGGVGARPGGGGDNE